MHTEFQDFSVNEQKRLETPNDVQSEAKMS